MSNTHDAFDNEDEVVLTKDDQMAERIARLAVLLMKSKDPVAGTVIKRRFYGDLKPDAADKAFRRDRERLASCGIAVEQTGADEGASYAIDAEASYAGEHTLGAKDAAALDLACRPLASDPSFPYSDDLAMALAKINDSFMAGGTGGDLSVARKDRLTATLRTCSIAHHACKMTYEDAHGKTTVRTVAPLGMFSLRASIYFVAAPVGEGGQVDEDGMRTFRMSRVVKASEVKGIRFEVPEDFDIRDHLVFPFQIGPTLGTAEFLVTEDRLSEASHEMLALGRGRLTQRDGRCVLVCDYSSVAGVVAWSIAYGLLPLAPEDVCQAWEKTLMEVTGDGR